MSAAASRVVLVTGASSGIGRLCAEHLAARGWKVLGTYRSWPAEKSAAIVPIVMDVDDDAAVRRGVDEALQQAGRIDAVINSAGYALAGSIEDTSIDEARAQMETNFFGVLRVCQAVLPAMRAQRNGTIVNISSLAGTFGLPYQAFYSASKFALEGLSESLRYETRQFGIRVVLIQPGDFRTGITARRRVAAAAESNPAYREMYNHFKAKQDQDEQRGETPEPIARLVEYVLDHPRPKLRYPIGMLSQRMVIPLKCYLPQRAFDWLAFRLMGV